MGPGQLVASRSDSLNDRNETKVSMKYYKTMMQVSSELGARGRDGTVGSTTPIDRSGGRRSF